MPERMGSLAWVGMRADGVPWDSQGGVEALARDNAHAPAKASTRPPGAAEAAITNPERPGCGHAIVSDKSIIYGLQSSATP